MAARWHRRLLPLPLPLLLLVELLLLVTPAARCWSGESAGSAASRALLDSWLRVQTSTAQRSQGVWRTKMRLRQSYVGDRPLPTCAPQQVCSTVYPRLQLRTSQCVCPRRSPPSSCSTSLFSTDNHSVPLVTDHQKGALTTVKTCEPSASIPACRGDDWALLAVQNSRTGRANFLVVCRCPEDHLLVGPMQHKQPYHAQVPVIRVYGMMCRSQRSSRRLRHRRRRSAGPRRRMEAAAVRRLLDLSPATEIGRHGRHIPSDLSATSIDAAW